MYLDSKTESECFGCEACVQACGKHALTMTEDIQGFRYPTVDTSLCVKCALCRGVCPYEHMPRKHKDNKYVFGGYNSDPAIRFDSTSGGAFSAIADAFCDKNYVIFGAEAKGLQVFHSYITDKGDIGIFRKSKYSQSVIGCAYRDARGFLLEGKKVLFSGTPCQIAGLLAFLKNTDQKNLLTVEVICEGVPSPLYIRKLDTAIEKKYGSRIEALDYRYTGKSVLSHGKWDFEQMKINLTSNKRVLVRDRWFNPFWSVWLQHLMSRPSCYKCKFTTAERVADITLGDLWGVHLYCPELYGNNGGASLVVCNSFKGREIFASAQKKMHGHELAFENALKYQSPMRKPIADNPNRREFMSDLQSDMDFGSINKKWAKAPSLKLLFQKYIWGNRQKIFFWRITRGRKTGRQRQS